MLYAGSSGTPSLGGLYEGGWVSRHDAVLMSAASPLKFLPSCDADGQTPPAFEVTVTFLVTERDPSNVVAFQ